MKYIYLPIDNISDFACYSVYDKDTIRAYKNMPQLDSSSNYVDFYINSHYLEKEGVQTWGQWSGSLPTCFSSYAVTTDLYYRTDILQCLLLFVVLLYLIFYLPLKLSFGRLFKRFL